MDLIKKITPGNSAYGKVFLVAIIALSILFIGYMVGQFAWYVSH
jgi:hypothetical protein